MQMSPQVRAIMGFSPPSETKQITPVTDRGYSQEYGSLDRAMSSVAMTKSDMSRASFAKTLNSNIKKINGILGAYKIEDILLREWYLQEMYGQVSCRISTHMSQDSSLMQQPQRQPKRTLR